MGRRRRRKRNGAGGSARTTGAAGRAPRSAPRSGLRSVPRDDPGGAASEAGDVPDDERRDVHEALDAARRAIAAGATSHRLASAAGVHPEDMKGFLAGRLTLTFPLRRRLRDEIPGVIATLDPQRIAPPVM